MLKKYFNYFLFGALGFGLLYYIFQSQSQAYLSACTSKGLPEAQCQLIDKLRHDFAGVNMWYILLILITYFLSNYLRAKKWEMLLMPLGVHARLSNLLGSTLIGYLVNLALPRAGEFARATALAKNENVPFDKAFGTIVSDRITDMICLLIIFFLALIFGYDSFFDYFNEHLDMSKKLSMVTNNTVLLSIVFVTLTIAGMVVLKYKTQIWQSSITKKVSQFLIGLKEGLLSVTKLEKPYLFSFFALSTWICYFLMAYFMFKAYTPTAHLGVATGLVVFVFGTLGIIFPSPAGMGSYHFLIMEGLALYHIDKTDGFVYANLMFFTVQIMANVIFGTAAFLWMQKTVNK
jgi:glycosyltransferase 2 family protein